MISLTKLPDITKVIVEFKNQEELEKIILIFLSYGYFWIDKNSIYPELPKNFKGTHIALTKYDLRKHHLDKGYRICFTDKTANTSRIHIPYETFIERY